MNTQFQRFCTRVLRISLLTSLTAAAPLLVRAGTLPDDPEQFHSEHGDHGHAAPAKLVEIVRQATRQYLNVNAAGPDYQPFLGCVSGPDHGAMGVHYVNSALVADGEIEATRPEALIYETSGNRTRLVGVEYIVDSATWLANHDGPPVLEGQSFQFVNGPNRYGLLPFFELHVWAWRDNPDGAFVDWNTRVSCEGQ